MEATVAHVIAQVAAQVSHLIAMIPDTLLPPFG
jgi:hypothetical protein